MLHRPGEYTSGDMCVLFHFQDPTHFYYVHFAASSDDVHNIIGLVNGADRVKVNAEPAGKSVFRMTDMRMARIQSGLRRGVGRGPGLSRRHGPSRS